MRTEEEIRARVSFLENVRQKGIIGDKLITVSEDMDFYLELEILKWVLESEANSD